MMKYFLLFILFVSCGSPDSGNSVDGVASAEHRIFVTSTSYSGNLGGLAGADSICQNLATGQGLVRDYKAILSTDSFDAANRLQLQGAIYNFNNSGDRVTVVELGANLWTGELLNEIQFTEALAAKNTQVWTGSSFSGTVLFDDHCDNWTSDSSGLNGFTGVSTSSTDQAVESGAESCEQSFSLYCISQ